jgi:hypothetical protein
MKFAAATAIALTRVLAKVGDLAVAVRVATTSPAATRSAASRRAARRQVYRRSRISS